MKNWFLFFLIVSGACSTKNVDPPEPYGPLPTPAQLAWHDMEMNAFVHFTTNTFTDKEWGFGDEPPGIFNPTSFDAGQWVRIFAETGFRGVILTCKHHDGFCLWPSQFTEHSVKNSPWQHGNGDVVKAVADACRNYGLKFGVYVSPWDRNHKDYGTTAYLQYYRNQLMELFTRYGPMFEMWFDGANGGDGFYGGAREKRAITGSTYYDWPTTMNMVRRIEPNIIFFSDAGPGVRWVGNESGIAGETNWSSITPDTLYAGKPGLESILNTGSEDGTHWIPAEVDVSIRPGWFHHTREDSLVKSPEQLFEIYLTSVGRGSTLLLNVPPDRRGLIHESDTESLGGLRALLDKAFRLDLAKGAMVTATTTRGGSSRYGASNLTDGDPTTYWATDDNVTSGSVVLNWERERKINYVVLQEYIQLGQRIRRFSIDAWDKTEWKPVAAGTTIGHKRILRVNNLSANKIRITITDSKACPILHTVAAY